MVGATFEGMFYMHGMCLDMLTPMLYIFVWPKRWGATRDTDYDPGTSGSEAGTPKKGRKKKETPDPGLTLGTDIEDHLKPDGRQVEVELNNVRIHQEKTKGQIRRRDVKLLQKRIESLEAAPPTGPLHVVLWEDNSMLPTDFSLFSLREPSRKDVSHICGLAIIGVYLDSTAWKRLRRFGRSDAPRVWICSSGILHASPIL